MATFDQLSTDQRAIIELVLKQGRSYRQLGDMLDMPEERVRRLARGSLLSLSPVSAAGVEKDWRGPIADYLLEQQSGEEANETKEHLRGSEGARTWCGSLLDSLEQLYEGVDLPEVPGLGGAPPPAAPTDRPKEPKPKSRQPVEKSPEDAPPPGGKLSPAAREAVRRRRIAAGAAFAVFGLLALLVWPIGLITGGDDDGDKATAEKKAKRPQARVVGQLALKAVNGAKGTGVAVVAQRGKSRSLIVQARLPVSANREAYEVWLYNSDRDARSVGAQVTDRQGTFQGASALPADFARYKFIDVSRENVDRDRSHSGASVLRGQIDQFQLPPPGAQDGGQGSAQPGAPGAQTQP